LQLVKKLKTQTNSYRYEAKVLGLEEELNEALEKEDYDKAAALKKEQEKAEEVIAEIQARQKKSASQTTGRIYETTGDVSAGMPQRGEIRMTPAEFENIIDEILDGMNSSGNIDPMVREKMLPNGSNSQQLIREGEINRRVGELEKQIEKIDEKQDALEKTLSKELKRGFKDFTKQLNTTLEKLNDKIDKSNRQMDTRIQQLEGNDSSTPASPQQEKSAEPAEKQNKDRGNRQEEGDDEDYDDGNDNEEDKQKVGVIFPPSSKSPNVAKKQGLKENSIFSKMNYAGTSSFAGFNLGGSNTANIGLRGHYPIGEKQALEFAPETFVGIGSTTSFGLSGNLLAPVKIKQLSTIRPYVGAGLGLMKIEQNESDEFRGAFNLILGSYLNVWKGRLYVDLTGRNFFRNSQLVAGYRLPF